jgi:HAD superfamily hydrolase (TIGR01509 family)
VSDRNPTGDASSLGRLDAVLFDMDGVVTETAEAHAETWAHLFDQVLFARAAATGEAFVPFDARRDYRKFVDGKPRHDGIRSFLRSRDVELPEGAPGDPPEALTVFGLGARKQRDFERWLEAHPVRAYQGTLELIDQLVARGVKTAVFSSSKNMRAILRSAGVADTFEATVDGNDLEALGIPGKPDPAMLLEAAARLGVHPSRAGVVEDALSGVEAGARGGFAFVIGVDRDGRREALKEAGADLVVRDLGELRLDRSGRIVAAPDERRP